MNSELFNFLTTQGVFALLFGYLLLYVLKQNQIREENYQNIIKQLSNTLPEIQNDLEDIKKQIFKYISAFYYIFKYIFFIFFNDLFLAWFTAWRDIFI